MVPPRSRGCSRTGSTGVLGDCYARAPVPARRRLVWFPLCVALLACDALVSRGAGDATPREADPGASDDEDAKRLAALVVDAIVPPAVTPTLELDEITSAHRGARVRVHGHVAADPILQRSGGDATAAPAYRFVIEGRGARLAIDYDGALPDRFQNKLEVMITGTLSSDGASLHGDDLIAKCPDRYEAAP